MVFGQPGINKLAKGTKIRYGSVPAGYTGTNLWRIGSSKTSNTDANDAMFVVSEYTWRGPNQTIVFNLNQTMANANTYQGSQAQKWCTDFYNKAFSSTEKAYIVSYNKTDAADRIFSQEWGPSTLTTNDKVFFLSADELWRYVNQNYAPATDINGNKTGYWLRSPYTGTAVLGNAMVGVVGGEVGAAWKEAVDATYSIENGGNAPYAARPGFNISKENMILVSAIGSKAVSVGSMTRPSSGSEYRLTFLDRSLSVTAGDATNDGTTVMIPFSGTSTSSGTHISAVIIKNGTVRYYGQMSQGKASGTISIPYRLFGVGDELYIFSERCSDGASFDYVSEPVEIAIPDPPAPQLGYSDNSQSSNVETADINATPATNLPAVKIKGVTRQNRGFTVSFRKLSKKSRKKIDGIEVQYSRTKDFSDARTLRVKKTASSKRIKKLSRNARYFVRLRTYKGRSYSKWSAVKRIRTR